MRLPVFLGLVVDRTIIALVRAGMIISAALILVVGIAGAIDVFTTNVIGKPIPIVSEMSADALAVIIFMAIGYAQHRREHVAVDILTARLPNVIRKILELLAVFVSLAFVGIVAWQAVDLAGESLSVRESAMALISYPVFPFKIAFLVGLVIAVLEIARQLAWLLVKGAYALNKLEE
jgi:TRAP-type C4-dicarboxylate transport system permease small subunit